MGTPETEGENCAEKSYGAGESGVDPQNSNSEDGLFPGGRRPLGPDNRGRRGMAMTLGEESGGCGPREK